MSEKNNLVTDCRTKGSENELGMVTKVAVTDVHIAHSRIYTHRGTMIMTDAVNVFNKLLSENYVQGIVLWDSTFVINLGRQAIIHQGCMGYICAMAYCS